MPMAWAGNDIAAGIMTNEDGEGIPGDICFYELLS
jgi:hypothetical protein